MNWADCGGVAVLVLDSAFPVPETKAVNPSSVPLFVPGLGSGGGPSAQSMAADKNRPQSDTNSKELGSILPFLMGVFQTMSQTQTECNDSPFLGQGQNQCLCRQANILQIRSGSQTRQSFR